MNRRRREIRGELKLQSAPAQGTTVMLLVSLAANTKDRHEENR